MATPQEDHDQRLKEAVKSKFSDAIDLMAPTWLAWFDFGRLEWLEQEIDRLNADLAPLRSFILPGGSVASAYLHLARTVCRRGDRLMVELNDQLGESVTPEAIKYVNRLSDFLFVAGRYANHNGRTDVLWVPGQNR